MEDERGMMEGAPGDHGSCPNLLDLIPDRSDRSKEDERRNGYGVDEEQKLELRLGLAGEPSSTLSLGLLPVRTYNPSPHGRPGASFLVGWPPVRSFRKKQGSSSFKQTARNESPEKSKANGVSRKTMLVKVNVDGIPIGRKIDLEAHRSYDELVSAVDELFCGLLAAQSNGDRRLANPGLLNGSRHYTLVYEDDEGDVLLVGDVPWDMFVSAVKRLRVMKSSELSSSPGMAVVGGKRGVAAAAAG